MNLLIKPEVENEFRTWLAKHVEEMLAFKGFTNATIYDRKASEESSESTEVLITCTYRYGAVSGCSFLLSAIFFCVCFRCWFCSFYSLLHHLHFLNSPSSLLPLQSVESREALEDYFVNHAAAMRQDGLKRFEGKLQANR